MVGGSAPRGYAVDYPRLSDSPHRRLSGYFGLFLQLSLVYADVSLSVALDSLKGFSDKVYLASIEINAKSLKHPVMERLHAYRRSDEFPVPGFGSFVELRDMPPSDETETFRSVTGLDGEHGR